MGRLCERPGCSEPASVAYGMRAEDLVFWLDTLRPDTYQSGGVLCQRHAQSMVVPRHWTLDDLRDPMPRLFRPPTSATSPAPPRRRRRTGTDPTGDQLLLTVDPAELAPGQASADITETPGGGDDEHPRSNDDPDITMVDVMVDVMVDGAPPESAGGGTAVASPWTPNFDESDDLDGLLSARSPLLARAFRGDDRPRRA